MVIMTLKYALKNNCDNNHTWHNPFTCFPYPAYIDGCPLDNSDPRYVWQESELSIKPVELSCPCGKLDISDLNRIATRVCGGSYSSGVMWESPNIQSCRFDRTTEEICNATFVSWKVI